MDIRSTHPRRGIRLVFIGRTARVALASIALAIGITYPPGPSVVDLPPGPGIAMAAGLSDVPPGPGVSDWPPGPTVAFEPNLIGPEV